MVGRFRVWWLLCVLVLSACGSGGASPAASPSDGRGAVYEVRVNFTGRASALGTTHEWYAPGPGFYRVERRAEGRVTETVYDGRSITSRTPSGLAVADGSAPFLRVATAHPDLFRMPGVTILRAYLTHRYPPGMTVTATGDGHVLHARLPISLDAGVTRTLTATVTITGHESMVEADQAGVFAPLTGRPVSEFHQAPAGSMPRLGEPAYWFGPKLGAARAVTALETRGIDVWADDPGSNPPSYTTVYRLPRGMAPTGVRIDTAGTFPGIGNILPIDITLDCMPAPALPGIDAGVSPASIRLDDGTPARIYVEGYQQGDREGSSADIVIGEKTTCWLRGLVSTSEVRRLAPSLRPLA